MPLATPIPPKDKTEIKAELNQALICFADFIYALVFGLVVIQLFDELCNGYEWITFERLLRLFTLLTLSYYLVWDWILGRILTLRNSYVGYTPFYCEVLIACFGYGSINAASKGNVLFIPLFGFVLVLGGIWARRMEEAHATSRDVKEFCTIQITHFTAAILTLLISVLWHCYLDDAFSARLVFCIFALIWFLIFSYEMMVPRPRGSILGGPGVPFIARSRIRKLKRSIS
jgi:hypothetical protein